MNDTTETKDLYLASLWYAKGMRLADLKREGKTCWFVFGDKNRCDEIQKNYFLRQELVLAKDYSDAIRSLKDLIFSV